MSSNLQMKILAKETAIYGVSSIVGKFLNWMLVPLYTYVLQQQSDYGIVTNLYAWTALLLVILTYGMETGFFRFANKEGENAQTVYSTSLIALFTTSLLFAVACVVCQVPIANALGYPAHSEFIALLGIVVAMDAFASIPFAYLRYKKRPLQFAALKLLFVFLNIVLNLFFLVLCPKIQDWGIISAWYNADYGVGYVFVANILATGIQTLCLLPAVGEGFRSLGVQEFRGIFLGVAQADATLFIAIVGVGCVRYHEPDARQNIVSILLRRSGCASAIGHLRCVLQGGNGDDDVHAGVPLCV